MIVCDYLRLITSNIVAVFGRNIHERYLRRQIATFISAILMLPMPERRHVLYALSKIGNVLRQSLNAAIR